MFLTNGNLTIRNATVNDAQTLCNWWNDGKVMAHAGFPNGLGTTVEKIILDLATDTDDRGRRLILDIDNIAVGEMSYKNKGDNLAEIGIKICDSTKQDKGFGPRFIRMLIESLYSDLGYEKIILDTNLSNRRAQHVYESIGFKKTATNLDSWRNQVGEIQSSVDYALTKREYLNKGKIT